MVQINLKLFCGTIRNNCAGRACFDGIEYVTVTDHVHTTNPEESTSMKFKSIINTDATSSYDPPQRIIHEALLYTNKNTCTLSGQELFFIFDTNLLNLLK